MISLLLGKDFRRVWRNPWPWVLNLSLPIAITALFGFAFGGGGGSADIAKIRVAIVDEDQSFFGTIFRSALSQGEAAERFAPATMKRAEALAQIKESKLSAIIIVPTNFTSDFLLGHTNVALEVIKNPAARFYPAIVEELLEVAVTGLNAVHRNFNSEFPVIRASFTNEFDLVKLGEISAHLGNRIKGASAFLNPPLVQYKKALIKQPEKKESAGMSVFAFILPGMASAFLLFLADHSMRDVHRETRMRTLDRIRSVRSSARDFVVGKVIFAALSVVLGSAILFGGGGLMFGINWREPGLLAIACAGYAIFAAGLMAMLVAIITNERKAETINNMVFFAMAFLGGSYVPADQLPAFMRENICPLMPNYWFIEAVRGLQNDAAASAAFLTVLKLAAAGAVMALIASALLERRLSTGARS